jgi:succinate dehydrogenase/fumarate reductase flavoprotein subunit
MDMRNEVIVIGAGLGGMIASLAAQAEGAQVSLIDRGSVGLGTNSALAGGLFTGPTFLHNPQEYIEHTLEAGRWINRMDFVRLVAREAPDAFELLRSMGLQLMEFPTAYSVRSPSPETIPGVTMVKTVAERIRGARGIRIVAGFYVRELLKDDNGVYGVKGLTRAGSEAVIRARALVLATGGAGAIYLKNDNQKTSLGQGYRLAARAGLQLRDMEFVQFYPLVIAEPHLPPMLVYPPYPQEVRLVSSTGENILARYGITDINEAIMKKRDQFSVIIFNESKTGPVLMDYSRVPETGWSTYPLTLFRRLHFDFRTKPFAVSPAAHFCMGGVEADGEAQTGVPGLFACGEVVGGLHGANRRGGNALTECLVMGGIAGRSAARYAMSNKLPPTKPETTSRRDGSPHGSGRDMSSFRDLRQQIREIAWQFGGILRDRKGITEGLQQLQTIEQKLKHAGETDLARQIMKEDLLSAAFSLRAVLSASAGREESRGSFLRRDFPEEDNISWRKNSYLIYDPEKEAFSVAYHPATYLL